MYLHESEELISLLHELCEEFPAEQSWQRLLRSLEARKQRVAQPRPGILPPASVDEWERWSSEACQCVLAGEHIEGPIFYPKQVRLAASSTVNGGTWAREDVEVAEGAVVEGDIVSQTAIRWQGRRARSLIAPEIHLDQVQWPLEVHGSIVCRRLLSMPPNSIRGSIESYLLVSDAPPDAAAKTTAAMWTIAGGSHIGGARVPFSIQTGVQVTIGRLWAAGDVILGQDNEVEQLQAADVHIGAGCTVSGAVRARGELRVERGTTMGSAIAEGEITLSGGVEVIGGLVASVHGCIRTEGDGWVSQPQYRYRADVSALLAGVEARSPTDRRSGSLAVRWLPHDLYYRLRSINESWCAEMEPFEDDR